MVRRSHGNSGGEGYVGLTRLDAVLGRLGVVAPDPSADTQFAVGLIETPHHRKAGMPFLWR